MKLEMYVLHGAKDFPNKLPLLKISKSDLIKPFIKWSRNITSEEEFKIFQQYLLKIIPKLLRNYNYIDLTNLKNIQKLLIQNLSWKDKLDGIKKILTQP